jgi:hypothetical protein
VTLRRIYTPDEIERLDAEARPWPEIEEEARTAATEQDYQAVCDRAFRERPYKGEIGIRIELYFATDRADDGTTAPL